MIAKRILSVLFITIALPAFADGRTQLERAAGVGSGIYTLDELNQIVTAEEHNEATRIKNYLSGDQGTVARARFAPHVNSFEERGSKGSDR